MALMALGLPASLHAFLPVLRWAYSNGDAPVQFALVRLAISFALLALPAASMGASFPLVAAWFTSFASGTKPNIFGKSAADVGLLYAANSAGAAVGALIAGFWAIPAIGFSGTTWLGVILNVAAALGALWLGHNSEREILHSISSGHEGTKAQGQAKRSSAPPWMAAPRPGLACSIVFLSGFVALASKVAWTRLLELVIGATTFAFTTMAMSFISGIAIGSAIGAGSLVALNAQLCGLRLRSFALASAERWPRGSRPPACLFFWPLKSPAMTLLSRHS